MLSVFFEGNLVEKLDMDLPPVSSRTEKVQALAPDYKISKEGMNSSDTRVSWLSFVMASKMPPTRAKQRQWRLGRQSVDPDVRLKGESRSVTERKRQDGLKRSCAQKRLPKQQVVQETQTARRYKWRSRRSPLSVTIRCFQRQRVPQSAWDSMQENLDADLQCESQRMYIAGSQPFSKKPGFCQDFRRVTVLAPAFFQI